MKKPTYVAKIQCTVDIGNTKTKVGFFDKNQLIKTLIFNDFNLLIDSLKEYDFDKMIISNVGGKAIDNLIETNNPIVFNHQTKIPILNKYESPKTLGIDRLAAAIGANSLYSNSDILIIDAGSCITYDFINKKSEYLGGGISPGIQMKYKALHNFTSKLPLIDSIDKSELIGRSTEKSIMSGVINGTISEISGIINRYQNISDNFVLLFCGGDGDFIKSQINYQSKYEENLVLIGLNEVLKFNA